MRFRTSSLKPKQMPSRNHVIPVIEGHALKALDRSSQENSGPGHLPESRLCLYRGKLHGLIEPG